MRETDTVGLLAEWGKWSRGGYGNLGTRSAMAVAMELVEPAANRTAINICDDDALRVEQAIRALRESDQIAVDALKLYFVEGLGEVQVSLRMGCSLVRAQKILAGGMRWVDCYLRHVAVAA